MSKSDEFKVEELEQRLEMAKWSNTSKAACTSGDCRGYIGFKVSI
ncbi:hypothetical protein Murru_3420 [Allomuricauda ruestringensis DSM 13258]|uniref:Uncharacterized protein n=1 Tax=Allomuricauda ruestringensis (strain DSM 13258 / CIP 107369 / LMG 19739 / B1) TaxID=886377 RepID=G2PNL9_ALLRU|nr:hypothetical protein Murru_3420 [Allomuricauda ruestringensis DSM 13258]